MRLNQALFLTLLLAGCAPEQPGYEADEDYEAAIDAGAAKAGHTGAAGALAIEPGLEKPAEPAEQTEEEAVDEENARGKKYQEDLEAAFAPPPDPT